MQHETKLITEKEKKFELNKSFHFFKKKKLVNEDPFCEYGAGI